MLFVLPNVNRDATMSLSARCDIPLTEDLGNNMAVLIIHKRVLRETYVLLTWRGILKFRSVVSLGCKWRVGDSTQIKFQNDMLNFWPVMQQ